MELVALWAGFIGSWLLVTGSVFQAAIELNEFTHLPGRDPASRERLMTLATPPPPLSPWWWLLPPVAYALQAVRTRRYRDEIMQRMEPVELRAPSRCWPRRSRWSGCAGSSTTCDCTR